MSIVLMDDRLPLRVGLEERPEWPYGAALRAFRSVPSELKVGG
jgi:hypothetical protein